MQIDLVLMLRQYHLFPGVGLTLDLVWSWATNSMHYLWRGESDFSTRISHDALEFLSSVDGHAFILVPFPYVGLDWKGCANILFIVDYPSNERGNNSVLFKKILTHSLACFY